MVVIAIAEASNARNFSVFGHIERGVLRRPLSLDDFGGRRIRRGGGRKWSPALTSILGVVSRGAAAEGREEMERGEKFPERRGRKSTKTREKRIEESFPLFLVERKGEGGEGGRWRGGEEQLGTFPPPPWMPCPLPLPLFKPKMDAEGEK